MIIVLNEKKREKNRTYFEEMFVWKNFVESKNNAGMMIMEKRK